MRKWALFGLCLLLLSGSVAGLLSTRQQQAEATRGWTNATETLDLPHRLPLLGINVDLTQYEPDEMQAEVARIAAAGFVWVRQTFLWEAIEPERGAFEWEAYDRIVRVVNQHEQLKLVAVIDGTPAWARASLAAQGYQFSPPASPEQYAIFSSIVADRYQDSITYYQIWDEPNIRSHWGYMDPRPAHYVAMLCGAYRNIHAADGDANVIAAALAPTVEDGPENLSDVLFLKAIYDLDGGACFDAAAGKPYGYFDEPYDRRVAVDVMNFSRWILLREEMVRRGDGTKPLWGSNFGWNALPVDWTGPPSIWGSVTLEQQEDYTRRAYQRAAREWPWAGGLILQHWDPDVPPDLPIHGFAMAPRIEGWLKNGPLLETDGLLPGLYPPLNPFATYSDNWQVTNSGADFIVKQALATDDPYGADARVPDADLGAASDNRITVQFRGTDFALPLQRDDYLAYLYVTVDGEPANALPRNRQRDAYIILTSPERTPSLDLITVASGLSDEVHTVEIVHRPDHGDDRWPLRGYAVASPPDTSDYERNTRIALIIGSLAALGAVLTATRLPWRNIGLPSVDTIRHLMDWLLSLFASFLVVVGALLTWGDALPGILRRDPPALIITIVTAGIASLSPVFVVTLAALMVLFVLIYNRPLLGIMLIIFWSAFFLSTLDLLFRLFATVEVYFILTLLAVAGRALVGWARERKETGQAVVLSGRLSLQSIDWVVLAFVALALVSLSWVTFWTPATRFLRVVVLEPAAFFFLLRVLRLDRRDVVWLTDTLLFTGGAIAVVGLVFYVTGESVVEAEDGARRLISVYGSPNGVGLYLGRCLPFALSYVLLPFGTRRRAYGAAAGVVMLLAVLLSQSRGAILLGLPAAFVVVLLLWRGRRALVPLVVAGVLVVLLLIPLSMALPRLTDLTGNTAFFREHLWYSSISLIREHPVTGVGPDQFLYWYRSRYLLPEAWEEPNLSVPHNILLNHWVTFGILGVVIGVVFQAVFWRKLWQVYRRAATRADVVPLMLVLGLAGSMADFLAHGLVDVSYFEINLAFVFFLSLALLWRIDSLTQPLAEKRE